MNKDIKKDKSVQTEKEIVDMAKKESALSKDIKK